MPTHSWAMSSSIVCCAGCQRRTLDAFGLDGLAVFAGPEHESADLVGQDRLLPLCRVEGVDEGEPLSFSPSERPDCLSVQRVLGRLRGRQAGRHHVGGADDVTLIAR